MEMCHSRNACDYLCKKSTSGRSCKRNSTSKKLEVKAECPVSLYLSGTLGVPVGLKEPCITWQNT